MVKVEKRDGRIVDFDGEKIVNAIGKAMVRTEKGLDQELARKIADKAYEVFKELEVVHIEQIQDFVEIELMRTRPDVAKLYILYREERARLRKQGWDMTDLQRDIYEQKYRFEMKLEEFLIRVSGENDSIKKAIKDKIYACR